MTTSAPENTDFNFEKSLKSLEKVVSKLESTNLSLEDSLKFFEEGVTLSKQCEHHLKDAEQKVEILTKSINDKFEQKPFNPEDNK